MVDLRVIQGGGGDGIDREAAYRAEEGFERLVIELLRSLARSDPSSLRISRTLLDLFRDLHESKAPVGPIVHKVLINLRGRLIVDTDDDFEEDVNGLKETSLKYAAECLSTDGFAKGRASQRFSDLTGALEAFVMGQEIRSRKYSGSYLLRLLGRLPPIALPKAPRITKPAKRKTAKARAKPSKNAGPAD